MHFPPRVPLPLPLPCRRRCQVMDFLVSGLDDEEFDLFIADSRIRVGELQGGG
jgi:hypothetical protein